MAAAGPQQYPLSAQYSDVPTALTSSDRKRVIPSTVRTVAVPSQSGDQLSGGQVLFQVSSNTGFIRPGSAFIKCRISVGAVGAFPSAVAGCTGRLQFGNGCRSASSIIERLTFSSGNVLEMIQNYGSVYVPSLMLHAGTQAYTLADDAILEGGKLTIARDDQQSQTFNAWTDLSAAAASLNNYIDVCIPVLSNLFQNEKAFPLALLSAPLLIQLDLASWGRAFYSNVVNAANPVADGYDNFRVSQAQFCYDLITPSAEYLSSLRAQIVKGNLYQIPFVSTLSASVARNSTTTTYTMGAGLSSLMAATYTIIATPSLITSEKYMISDNTLGDATEGSTNFRLLLDGTQQSSVVQNTVSSRYASMQCAFGMLGDTLHTSADAGLFGANAAVSVFNCDATAYNSRNFLGGQGCTRVNESFAMSGTAVSQVTIIVETTGSTASTLFLTLWHQRILAIDAAGSANIIQ